MIEKKKIPKLTVNNSKHNIKYVCPDCGYVSFLIIKCPICGDSLIKKMK